MNDVIAIIPAYKKIDLLKAAVNSVIENSAELLPAKFYVLVINDSPDDVDVCQYCSDIERIDGVSVIINQKNIGFVKSVNIGLDIARKNGLDCILINADTITFPGTLRQLVKASYADDQIGFACPRSNNAAIATFPASPNPRSGGLFSPMDAYSSWFELKDRLPEYYVAPTVVGFYLYIKSRVLQSFDGLDEIFGLGYEEENDLILRANKVGFISVLANHSFAYHYGSASFKLLGESVSDRKEKNLSIMNSRNPEFMPLVRNFEASVERKAEKMLRLLLPDSRGRLDVIFDTRQMGLSHNGTSVLAKKILSAFCKAGESRYNVYALCSKAVFDFHCLDNIRGLQWIGNISDNYAISISIGQPFDMDSINTMEDLAPINIYLMLDIIAHDCGYLRVENEFKLEFLWRHIAEHGDGIAFISKASAKTFKNRFLDKDRPSDFFFEKLLPTAPGSWKKGDINQHIGGGRHVLVLGNHFLHKGSMDAGLAIAENFPDLKIITFGDKEKIINNLEILRAGEIPENRMTRLILDASVIVFPSHYEGFGIGIMEALESKKPLVMRETPASMEILDSLNVVDGVYLYKNIDGLFDSIIRASVKASNFDGKYNWNLWGKDFCAFIDNIARTGCTFNSLTKKFRSSQLLNEHFKLIQIGLKNTQKPDHNILNNNSTTNASPTACADSLLSCFSAANDSEFLDRLFILLLGRSIDDEGMAHYRSLLNNKNDRVQILRDILFSREIKMRIPGLDGYIMRRSGMGFFGAR